MSIEIVENTAITEVETPVPAEVENAALNEAETETPDLTEAQSPALAEVDSLTPPVPQTIQDTGLPASMFEELIVKLLHSRGDMLGRELSEAMGVKFSLIEGSIDFLKRQHAIQAKKS